MIQAVTMFKVLDNPQLHAVLRLRKCYPYMIVLSEKDFRHAIRAGQMTLALSGMREKGEGAFVRVFLYPVELCT